MDIEKVIKTYYPYAIGAVLTGSQSMEQEFQVTRDIDIVVIDPTFSVISSFMTKQDQFFIDFTQIPLYNIENILIDESFEPNGIIISMFNNGRIIFDTKNNFTAEIVAFAKKLHSGNSPSKNEQFNQSIARLKKIGKHFNKELEGYEKFFLINDFFYLIVQAQLSKLNLQVNGGLYKAKELYKADKDFVNDLMELTLSSLQEKGPSHKIFSYIYTYADINPLTRDLTNEMDRVIINIYYKGISIENFIKEVLPKIKNHLLLADNYMYYFASPSIYHNIYRYPINIVFAKKNVKQISSIVHELNILLSKEAEQNYHFSLTANASYTIKMDRSPIINELNDFLSENSRICESLVLQNNLYDKDRFLLIAIIQITFVAGTLNVQTTDMLKLNFNICNQFLFSSREQFKIKHPGEILGLQKNKYEKFDAFYQAEGSWIDAALKLGIRAINDETLLEEKIYNRSIQLLRILIQKANPQEAFHADPITYKLLDAELKATSISSAIFYTNMVEQIFQSLNLNSLNASLCMFLISRSFNNVKSSGSVRVEN